MPKTRKTPKKDIKRYYDPKKKRGKRFTHKWKNKNLIMFILSIIVAYFLFTNETFTGYLKHLGGMGYLGALVAGILFSSTFTFAIGSVIILVLAQTLHPIELYLLAGFGCMLGDVLIMNFIKTGLEDDVKYIYNKIDHNHHIVKLFHTKYFSWTLPVIGSLFIMLPFPDELGVSILGVSKLSKVQFIILAFILDTLGIMLLVSAERFVTCCHF